MLPKILYLKIDEINETKMIPIFTFDIVSAYSRTFFVRSSVGNYFFRTILKSDLSGSMTSYPFLAVKYFLSRVLLVVSS